MCACVRACVCRVTLHVMGKNTSTLFRRTPMRTVRATPKSSGGPEANHTGPTEKPIRMLREGLIMRAEGVS